MEQSQLAGPLSGILVVDLTRYLPGPYASAELVRLGARVVRLEAPGGDPLRRTAPGWHAHLNHGKESVVCDMTESPALGQALCRSADVVLEGFRPGVAERLGVGPDDLPPGVVYLSIRGFEDGSPWFLRAGHDVNYLGLAGVLDPERPALPPIPIADLAAGALTAVARVVAGLFEKSRTGRGSVIRVSMTTEAHRLVAFRHGEDPVIPRMLNGGLACYDVYRCADGAWISLGALEPKFFVSLCRILGVEELIALQFDAKAQPSVRETLVSKFDSRPRQAWLDLLADEDTCVAPVLSLAESTDGVSPPPARPELGGETAAWQEALGFA
jgi:alpha-methylacyl-CoA racemase